MGHREFYPLETTVSALKRRSVRRRSVRRLAAALTVAVTIGAAGVSAIADSPASAGTAVSPASAGTAGKPASAGTAGKPASAGVTPSSSIGHLASSGIVGVYGTTTVNAVSCAPSGYCLVGGQARDSTGDYGFVATIDDGTVGSLVDVQGMTSVAAVACPQKGWCLAFGFGQTADELQPDELAAIVGGKPAKAAVEIGENVAVTGLSCESANACFVIGSINNRGFVYPIIHGVTGTTKYYPTGQLMNAISCPPSLNTCVVMGTNPSSSHERTAYVVRISGTQPSAVATKIGGISDPTAMDCSAYYSCLVAGIDAAKSEGEVENVSHTTASDIQSVRERYVYATTCATSSRCVSIAYTSAGAIGIVPVSSGAPGTFTQVMGGESDQALSGIACQGADHCYAVGSDFVNRRIDGIVYGFTL